MSRPSPAQLAVLFWCFHHEGRVSLFDRVRASRQSLARLVERGWLRQVSDVAFETTEAGKAVGSFAPVGPAPTRPHGVRSTHAAGCRCRPCCDAYSVYQALTNKRYRARKAAALALQCCASQAHETEAGDGGGREDERPRKIA